jgi:hypothetical protein
MSTLKSSAEDLTLNADGSGNDIKFQSNAVEKASLSDAGLLTTSGGASLDGAVTINETGADVDFRVESDDNANMLFVDGGEDRVGIGTGTPARTLHVSDTTSGATTGIRLTGANNGSQVIEFADTDDANVGYIQYDHNNNRISLRANDTNILNIDSDGLKFNADTAAANALDDYEEGTFTPTVSADTVTYTTQIGRYTKIGNKVFIDVFVHINTITPTSSYSIILGLPFTSAATWYPALATKANGFSWGGSATMLTFQVQPSATTIGAAGAYNNGAFNDVNANGLAAGDWIAISGSYTV